MKVPICSMELYTVVWFTGATHGMTTALASSTSHAMLKVCNMFNDSITPSTIMTAFKGQSELVRASAVLDPHLNRDEPMIVERARGVIVRGRRATVRQAFALDYPGTIVVSMDDEKIGKTRAVTVDMLDEVLEY